MAKTPAAIKDVPQAEEAEALAAEALAAVPRDEYFATLTALFKAALAGGVVVDDKLYATDDAAKSQLIEAAVFGGPDGALILGANHEARHVTADKLAVVIAAVRDHRQACFENAQRLDAALRATLTPDAVDLSEGWPA